MNAETPHTKYFVSPPPSASDGVSEDTASHDNAPAAEIEIFDDEGALSRAFLLQRGYCCGNGCKNCPYGFHESHVDEGEA